MSQKVCCRCENHLDADQALGGAYGGVVCTKHRCCVSCWFETIPIGKRWNEDISTRTLPLVDNPFRKKCCGCDKKLLPFYDPNDIIEIE